jgi:thiamine-phosphate pyrophosphorylase
MATDEITSLARKRARRAEKLHGIYVIINEDARAPVLACDALDAGVKVLQYRAKDGINVHRVEVLRQHTRAHGALLIVNDDWRAALAYDCDGVHLGPDDEGFAAIARVRAALGDRLIGLSCGTIDEVRFANAQDVDYIGVGAVFATASKADAGAPIGIAGLRAIVAESRNPVAAIGGIGLAQIDEVRLTGVAMVALISAVADARDPKDAARTLVERWHAGDA